MKLVLGLIAAFFSTAVVAGPYHHGHRVHHHRHWQAPPVHHWVVPALIGGAVVYAATRPDPVVVQQPVIVQQPLQSNQVVIDGIIYTKQIMIINGVQTEVLVKQ